MKKRSLATLAALAASVVAPVLAQAAPRTERVTFAKGASSKVIQGSIKGDAYVDYVVNARGGQLMTVKLTTSRGSNYFNVMPKGSETAYFIASRDGNEFRGPVPETGDQVIRVYLMQVDEDGNELGSWRGLATSVPLGTYTAWNYQDRRLLEGFGMLSGLQGAFIPFPTTEGAAREEW